MKKISMYLVMALALIFSAFVPTNAIASGESSDLYPAWGAYRVYLSDDFTYFYHVNQTDSSICESDKLRTGIKANDAYTFHAVDAQCRTMISSDMLQGGCQLDAHTARADESKVNDNDDAVYSVCTGDRPESAIVNAYGFSTSEYVSPDFDGWSWIKSHTPGMVHTVTIIGVHMILDENGENGYVSVNGKSYCTNDFLKDEEGNPTTQKMIHCFLGALDVLDVRLPEGTWLVMVVDPPPAPDNRPNQSLRLYLPIINQ